MGLWSQRLGHGVRCGVMESGFREVGSWGKVWGLWSQGFVRLGHSVRCGVMESGFREVGS